MRSSRPKNGPQLVPRLPTEQPRANLVQNLIRRKTDDKELCITAARAAAAAATATTTTVHVICMRANCTLGNLQVGRPSELSSQLASRLAGSAANKPPKREPATNPQSSTGAKLELRGPEENKWQALILLALANKPF